MKYFLLEISAETMTEMVARSIDMPMQKKRERKYHRVPPLDIELLMATSN